MSDIAEMDLTQRLPTHDEAEKAREAMTALANTTTDTGNFLIKARNNYELELPAALGRMLLDLLMHISRGEAVSFVPFGAELTTQQAADMLNVSRPFLVKLLERGEIPHRRVGSHRRVNANDMIQYRVERSQKQKQALNELTRLGQEIDDE